jgi:hypothetical protein
MMRAIKLGVAAALLAASVAANATATWDLSGLSGNPHSQMFASTVPGITMVVTAWGMHAELVAPGVGNTAALPTPLTEQFLAYAPDPTEAGLGILNGAGKDAEIRNVGTGTSYVNDPYRNQILEISDLTGGISNLSLVFQSLDYNGPNATSEGALVFGSTCAPPFATGSACLLTELAHVVADGSGTDGGKNGYLFNITGSNFSNYSYFWVTSDNFGPSSMVLGANSSSQVPEPGTLALLGLGLAGLGLSRRRKA